MLSQKELADRINRLRQEKNAIILAHYYQKPEIQDIADFVGDSLELSRKAADNDADMIVFCGVRFMAETAKTLSPAKTVILPAADAGCPMADMMSPEDVTAMKRQYPNAAAVCYVNTTTAIKAVCDYCVTSANAVKVIQNIPEQEIIFVPDRNLGRYVASLAPEKKFHYYDGNCPVHHSITPEDVGLARKAHPEAVMMAHPECQPEVLALADFVGSTGQILRFARESDAREMLVCTEEGILHQLEKESPDKVFFVLSPKLVCGDMKKIDLALLLSSMETMEESVSLPEEQRLAAKKALDNMLMFS